MARNDPPDYGADNPTGYGGNEPEPQEPIPGWRKPIALVGWGVLIAVLIGLIIWGIIQLAQGAPTQAPATTTTTTTTTTPTTDTGTTSTTPTPTTTDTGTPTTNSPSPGALHRLPSQITLRRRSRP